MREFGTDPKQHLVYRQLILHQMLRLIRQKETDVNVEWPRLIPRQVLSIHPFFHLRFPKIYGRLESRTR